MSWESFINETLDKLHEGEKLPAYFGCISNLLTGSSPLPPKRQKKRFYEDFESDSFQNQSPKKQIKTPEKIPPKIVEEEDEEEEYEVLTLKPQKKQVEEEFQYSDDNESSSGSFTKKEEPNIKRPPPIFDSDDESSRAAPIQKKKNHTPVREEYYNSEEENQLQNDQIKEEEEEENQEENQVQEEEESNEIDYASKFREIGDAIYGRYWAPIEDTTIPRMNLESRLFTTFKMRKFNKIFTMLEEKSNGTPNTIHFSRVNSMSDEEDEEEEEIQED